MDDFPDWVDLIVCGVLFVQGSYGYRVFARGNSCGSLAMFAAIRRASSSLSSLPLSASLLSNSVAGHLLSIGLDRTPGAAAGYP
jgi:hypothetical protein